MVGLSVLMNPVVCCSKQYECIHDFFFTIVFIAFTRSTKKTSRITPPTTTKSLRSNVLRGDISENGGVKMSETFPLNKSNKITGKEYQNQFFTTLEINQKLAKVQLNLYKNNEICGIFSYPSPIPSHHSPALQQP